MVDPLSDSRVRPLGDDAFEVRAESGTWLVTRIGTRWAAVCVDSPHDSARMFADAQSAVAEVLKLPAR